MNELKSIVREMNYDADTLINTSQLKKVLGGTDNPPETDLTRTTQAVQSTTTICKVAAICGELV